MQAPQVIEPLDFEQILLARKARFLELCSPAEKLIWEKRLKLESEPVVKLLEESAFMELHLRNRINEAVKSCFLTTAKGTDLDNLASFYGEKRLILQEADKEKNQLEIKESDAKFLERIKLGFYKLASTGTAQGYKAHALSVSAKIKDVYVTRPAGGKVDLYLLAEDEDLSSLIQEVETYLNLPNIKILCDTLRVLPYEKVNYDLNITITLKAGTIPPNSAEFFQNSIKEFLKKQQSFGRKVIFSQISAFILSLNNEVYPVEDVQFSGQEPNVEIHQIPVLNTLSLAFK